MPSASLACLRGYLFEFFGQIPYEERRNHRLGVISNIAMNRSNSDGTPNMQQAAPNQIAAKRRRVRQPHDKPLSSKRLQFVHGARFNVDIDWQLPHTAHQMPSEQAATNVLHLYRKCIKNTRDCEKEREHIGHTRSDASRTSEMQLPINQTRSAQRPALAFGRRSGRPELDGKVARSAGAISDLSWNIFARWHRYGVHQLGGNAPA